MSERARRHARALHRRVRRDAHPPRPHRTALRTAVERCYLRLLSARIEAALELQGGAGVRRIAGEVVDGAKLRSSSDGARALLEQFIAAELAESPLGVDAIRRTRALYEHMVAVFPDAAAFTAFESFERDVAKDGNRAASLAWRRSKAVGQG